MRVSKHEGSPINLLPYRRLALEEAYAVNLLNEISSADQGIQHFGYELRRHQGANLSSILLRPSLMVHLALPQYARTNPQDLV